MTVVGLHPEELFDKLFDGAITPAEHERLRQHLATCDVCRFEYAARGDFRAEALQLAAEGPPPLLPLRQSPLPSVAKGPARRRRSRMVVWSLAAALLITASGAVASGVIGRAPWRAVSLMFSRATPPASQPVLAAGAAATTRAGCKGADCFVVTKPGEQAQAAAVADVPPPALEQAEPLRSSVELVPTRSGPDAGQVSRARQVSPRGTQAMKAAEPAAVKEPTAKEPTTSAKLFGEANQARRSGDVGRASGLYHLLQEQFPGSAEAELSRVTLSLLLLDSGDAQGALAGFERYLAGSSRGLEAEALVGRARALGRLGRRDLEASAWREVQRKYPRSIYGRQAGERLSALGQP
jgi:TolA-binding protein